MDSWKQLSAECEQCRRCSLGQTRLNCVFGTGRRDAKLMFVGEAPGQAEDETGIPFVGAAGKHLDLFLEAVGIPRESVYITNILKCRPPHNRDPLPQEQDCCMEYLRRQVRLVRPKMIICLGRIAAMRLIDPQFKISREHGILKQRGGFIMAAVYHPSALLRDPRKNEDMYKDIKLIKNKLEQL